MSEIETTAGEPADRLECDIVMAGGVTSGVIYPGAVEVISRRYNFRSIGGTSVGAIAAAATAAAEYGRLTGANGDAFRQIGALAETLGHQASDGRSRLFHLFTGEPATRPLFAFLTPLFSGGSLRRQIIGVLAAGLRVWPIAGPVGIVLLLGLAACFRLWPVDILFASLVVLMTAATALLTWATAAYWLFTRRLLPAWRANGYGVCTGMAEPAVQPQAEAQLPKFQGLTPWMHGVIQAAAGREKAAPLTFGDLWSAGQAADSETELDARKPRRIELAMIASDISRNRTAQLPFLESPSPLYVERDILAAYFPTDVVAWMISHAGPDLPHVDAGEDVARLPRPQDIPVVFGARLSLSFPVLLSAVPLLTPDFAGGKNKNDKFGLKRVWMSDGGLTSNFPIHFFDSPIPSRPTFCLNLVGFESETTAEADDEEGETGEAREASAPPKAGKAIATPRSAERRASKRPKQVKRAGDPKPGDEVWDFISMPRGNRFIPAVFTAFDASPGAGVGSFVSALLNTARFWSDNQLLLAPGVRDRVVNIGLRDDEGGLNLNMAPNVIAELDWRGRAAGLLISARFDPERETDPETGEANVSIFAGHRWTRYRNFMASFEDTSRRFAKSRRTSDEAASRRGEPLLDDLMESRNHGYPALVGARGYFRYVTNAFEDLALEMADRTRTHDEETFDRAREPGGKRPAGGAPRPRMQARLRPLADNDPRAEAAELPDRP
jgi:predicted acylesterase/phospholipase RssA